MSNNKIIVAGGLFDAKRGEYNSTCDLYDLENDTWRTISRLKQDRLNPFILPVGIEQALIMGGYKKNNQFVDKCEFMDT